MKILYAATDDGGSSFYRMYLPAKWMLLKNLHEIIMKVRPNVFEYTDGLDMVIVQRLHNPKTLEVIKKLQDKGIFVAYELDDDLWSLSDNNPNKIYYTPKVLKEVKEFIKKCDGVIVSTKYLADKLKSFNSNVWVIPNYVEDVKQVERPMNEKLRIGWSGGNSHDIDFSEEIIEALLAVKNDFDCELVFMGWVPEGLAGKVRFTREVPPQQYLGVLKTLNFDIGIIPCADIEFNKSKSCVKFLEYSVLGIPAVATNAKPYSDEVINGVTGLLAENNYKSWYQSLTALIIDAEQRKMLAHNSNLYIKENHLIKDKIFETAKLLEDMVRK